MARVWVGEADFEPGAEMAALAAGCGDVGAVGAFVGVVRADSGGRRLTAMTLEHYPAMTERALAAIAAEAEDRWELLGCTVMHRVGRLAPGQRIVMAAAAARHRAAALSATGFLIDWLKTRAPFWKREEFADGAAAWVAARAEDEAQSAAWQ